MEGVENHGQFRENLLSEFFGGHDRICRPLKIWMIFLPRPHEITETL